MKDHLGNTRVIFTDNDNNGEPEIIQEADYYPFGMRHDRSTSATNHYLYNGKELNDDLGLDWYDYGARWLDVETGRWSTVDPLAEKFDSWSGYHYAINNPINTIAPNGMDTLRIHLQQIESNATDAVLFRVTFSIVKNGIEDYLPNNITERDGGEIYATSNAGSWWGKNALPNDIYDIKWQQMGKHIRKKLDTKSILIQNIGRGQFFHRGTLSSHGAGCLVLGFYPTVINIPAKKANNGDIISKPEQYLQISDGKPRTDEYSEKIINGIFELYEKAKKNNCTPGPFGFQLIPRSSSEPDRINTNIEFPTN